MTTTPRNATHFVNDSGVTGTFALGDRRVVAAPASGAPASSHNTVRPAQRPVACVGFLDGAFAPGASFPSPNVTHAARRVAALRRFHAAPDGALPPLALFGHGGSEDAAERDLAGRRTRAIFALLTRNAGAWRALFDESRARGDDWAGPCRAALASVGLADGGRGVADADLPQHFERYMQTVMPDALEPGDFLFAGGAPDLRGAAQCCGGLNPRVIPSKNEVASATAADREALLRANRRVVLYLFPAGATFDLARWPCPALGSSASACAAQLFPRATERAAPAAQRREGDAGATYGCSYYASTVAYGSPCELPGRPTRFRLAVSEPLQGAGQRVRIEQRVGSGKDATAKQHELPLAAGAVAEHELFLPDARCTVRLVEGGVHVTLFDGVPVEALTAVRAASGLDPAAPRLHLSGGEEPDPPC
jgi:hypothetical protein